MNSKLDYEKLYKEVKQYLVGSLKHFDDAGHTGEIRTAYFHMVELCNMLETSEKCIATEKEIKEWIKSR